MLVYHCQKTTTSKAEEPRKNIENAVMESGDLSIAILNSIFSASAAPLRWV
jgi:hypothetical protein